MYIHTFIIVCSYVHIQNNKNCTMTMTPPPISFPRLYYWNQMTNETTWHRPGSQPPMMPLHPGFQPFYFPQWVAGGPLWAGGCWWPSFRGQIFHWSCFDLGLLPKMAVTCAWLCYSWNVLRLHPLADWEKRFGRCLKMGRYKPQDLNGTLTRENADSHQGAAFF